MARPPSTPNPENERKRKRWLEEWGTRIIDLRTRLGLTQRELAKRLNTSDATVARWESGTVAPAGDAVFRMLEFARDIGCASEFTGSTLGTIYRAMLNDNRLLPQKGLLVFLKVTLEGAEHFIRILNLIDKYGDAIHRFGTPGDAEKDEDGVHAYALFTLAEGMLLQKIDTEIRGEPYCKYLKLTVKARGDVDLPPFADPEKA